MNSDEVYRHIVVRLAKAGIVSPQISELPHRQEYSDQEADRLADEVVDYIEAKLKHSGGNK